MEFTNEQFKQFREDMKVAYKEIGEKYNLTLEMHGITYTDCEFNFKTVAKKDGSEKVMFEKYCKSYGFEPSDFERTFTAGNEKYQLVGFKPRSSVNNCRIIRLRDNQTRVCNHTVIQRAFALQEA